MPTPKISVIVPVYNSEKFLRKSLDSIRFQTYSNLEIICVDDESTDNSLEILKEYSKTDKRFVILSKKMVVLGLQEILELHYQLVIIFLLLIPMIGFYWIYIRILSI